METLRIYKNLSAVELFDIALQRGEGDLTPNGSLRVLTGERTGRSPKDRFIVKDSTTENTVDWGAVNQPIQREDFDRLWQDALEYLLTGDVFEKNYQVGSHPLHNITVNVRCHYAWHTLFCDHLFISPEPPNASAEWQLVNAANFVPKKGDYNLPGSAAIVLDFTKKRVLICGTLYGGEMKKAMFSVLNYLMPDQDVLPMHCAANRSADGSVSLFFGLSGTGKTTLSADPDRFLIGDDEHGWGSDGIFNFEGGCYAKCIRLSQKYEPLIWNAIQKKAVIENVVLDSNGSPNFDDDSVTENTRAAYPLDFIAERAMGVVHSHPTSVIFLACDLFGVLPPISKLTHEQIVYYFLSGYTALVGSTEVGQGEGIKPTFSSCFGAPFFSKPPHVYADLLMRRIHETNAEVYLVNTGWHGGAYGKGGERFPIHITRQIVQAITSGATRSCHYEVLEPFGLYVPWALDGIPTNLLNPALDWQDRDNYEKNAQELLKLFQENARQKGITG